MRDDYWLCFRLTKKLLVRFINYANWTVIRIITRAYYHRYINVTANSQLLLASISNGVGNIVKRTIKICWFTIKRKSKITRNSACSYTAVARASYLKITISHDLVCRMSRKLALVNKCFENFGLKIVKNFNLSPKFQFSSKISKNTLLVKICNIGQKFQYWPNFLIFGKNFNIPQNF